MSKKVMLFLMMLVMVLSCTSVLSGCDSIRDNYYYKYMELINECQEKYGIAQETSLKYTEYSDVADFYFTGLFIADLIDFNNDGTDELMLVYNSSSQSPDYVLEVWAYMDDELRLLSDECGICYHLSEYTPYIEFSKDLQSRYYLKQGGETDFHRFSRISYYSLVENRFEEVYSFQHKFNENNPNYEPDYYVNDEFVTKEEYSAKNDKLYFAFGYNLYSDSMADDTRNSVTKTLKEIEDKLEMYYSK